MAHITETAPDPTRVSPKVTAAAWTGGGLTALALVLSAVLEAIPGEALDGLGPWALPVGAGISTLAIVLAAYARRDPAREVTVVTETPEPVPDSSDLVLTEDQAVTEPVEAPVVDDPVELEQPVDDDPVERLARQVSA